MRRRLPLTAPANPGASSSATVYDTDATEESKRLQRDYDRVRVGFYTNVADATIVVEWAAPGSSNLRNVQTVAVSAATYTQRDVLLQPGRTKVYITTTTNPGTWEVGAELIDGHSLGQ